MEQDRKDKYMRDKYVDGLVSVIVPVYNAKDYLGETLESIFKQTYKNIEIICIDDMSTDGSRDLIANYAQKHDNIVPLLLEKNGGVANARNKGIEVARGRYIAFLDSDDIWLESKIEKQITYMQEKDLAFTFTGYQFMDENSKKMNTIVGAKDMLNYDKLLKHNAIACLTVVIDRDKVDRIHMPNIRHEDYITWLDILKAGHIAYGIDETLALYRTRANSLSGNKIKAASWTWNILRNVEKLSLPKALYCFTYYAIVNLKKHVFSK